MEGKYSYTLLGKVDGNTIPGGVNRKKGDFIIRENKKVILNVGN